MTNVLHIKQPKQKYEEQNHAVSSCALFFLFLTGAFLERCTSHTLLIHATSDIQTCTVCHKYGLKYTVMRMKYLLKINIISNKVPQLIKIFVSIKSTRCWKVWQDVLVFLLSSEYMMWMCLCSPEAAGVLWPDTAELTCPPLWWCRSFHWCCPPSPHTSAQNAQSERSQELKDREKMRVLRYIFTSFFSSGFLYAV